MIPCLQGWMQSVAGFYGRKRKLLKRGMLRKTWLKPVSGRAVVSQVAGRDPASRHLSCGRSRLSRKLREEYGTAGGLAGQEDKGSPLLRGLLQTRTGCLCFSMGDLPKMAFLVLPPKKKVRK